MECSFYDFLKLTSSLGLFLYGMKTMGEGLQKVAGDRPRNILTAITTNRVTGVLTGVLTATLIQSSLATTVMAVSSVNIGLLTLAEPISVIMDVNIGMTVTAWIISIFGLKVDMAAFVLPLLVIAPPLIFSGKSNCKSTGEFIFGFSFLLMGLSYLEANAPDPNANPEMLTFVQNYTDMGLFFILLFLFISIILATIVQASAITMATILVMCANGWIDLELGAVLVLGEDIGTTITANLAALTANTQTKWAALIHFVFNVFDVIWILIILHPFMELVNWIVDTSFQNNNPGVAISYKLSVFHSIFNICNVHILIWGVKLIEHVVYALIHPKEEDEEPRLWFIIGGIFSTTELSALQTHKEAHPLVEHTHRMFGMTQDSMYTEKDDNFNRLFSRVEKYENIGDNMGLEIANYLNQILEGCLGFENKLQVRATLREVVGVESIGDSYYNPARIINWKRQTNQDFIEKQYEHIHFMMKLTDDALAQMTVVVEKPEHQSIDTNKSFNVENEINSYRNQLENQNILDVNSKEYDYQMGVYYMDIITKCEKLGNYVVSVVEVSSDVKKKKASQIKGNSTKEMDSQFHATTHKLTIRFFLISTQTRQPMSAYKDTHTLQRYYISHRR